ncbi:hypothetical protein DMR_32030 [Solidesulfovibrio magneticus RS-1]|uniref:Uncharacterized protein n=1 Tax=Solidesulfovibrio magneticus (strain ATCC 700980 / DSM 13731 / RS-1) TaxID=573370 RepID=C4XJE4_SOLM1|nr:hypothetical protein DMR_32030 [Solidesulfovibrio magneticus RS-1]
MPAIKIIFSPTKGVIVLANGGKETASYQRTFPLAAHPAPPAESDIGPRRPTLAFFWGGGEGPGHSSPHGESPRKRP